MNFIRNSLYAILMGSLLTFSSFGSALPVVAHDWRGESDYNWRGSWNQDDDDDQSEYTADGYDGSDEEGVDYSDDEYLVTEDSQSDDQDEANSEYDEADESVESDSGEEIDDSEASSLDNDSTDEPIESESASPIDDESGLNDEEDSDLENQDEELSQEEIETLNEEGMQSDEAVIPEGEASTSTPPALIAPESPEPTLTGSVVTPSQATSTSSATSTPAAVMPPVMATSTTGTVQVISNNLIPNPGLQASSATATAPISWNSGSSGLNVARFQAMPIGPNGSPALETTITNYTDGDAKWHFSPIKVTPGEKYIYKNSYKSDVPSHITAQFSMASGTLSFIDLANPQSAADWTNASGEITVPPGATDMTVFHLIKQVGTLSVGDMSLVKTSGTAPLTTVSGTSTATLPNLIQGLSQQGMVTLTFDDGFASQYESAKPMLDAAGLKATYFITTGLLDDPNYMTTRQVLDLDQDGNEIGAHTRTHTDLVTLTPEQIQSEVAGSKADLETLLKKPVLTFDYPFGAYDTEVIKAVQDAGYVGARSVNPGYNNSSSDKFLLNDQHLESDVTANQAKQWIDQALANKEWLIMEIHDQNADGTEWSNSPDTLQAIIDYLKEKQASVVTLIQGLQLMDK